MSLLLLKKKKSIELKKLNSCMTKFATNMLLQQVQKSPENVAISPVSLSAVVAMLAAGSSGKTLEKVLKFTESESLEQLKSRFSKTMSIANSCSRGGPKISLVNGARADRRFPFTTFYDQCLRDTFNTEPTTKDFFNHDINSWAEQKTEGIIKNIISKEQISDPLTAAVMANALYFKGAWVDARGLTEHMDFHLDNENKVSKVPFLTYSSPGVRVRAGGNFPNFDVGEFSYKKEIEKNAPASFSMRTMVPHQTYGLQEMIKRFDASPDLLSCRPSNMHEIETFSMLGNKLFAQRKIIMNNAED